MKAQRYFFSLLVPLGLVLTAGNCTENEIRATPIREIALVAGDFDNMAENLDRLLVTYQVYEGFICCASYDVEVDPETGKVEILRYTIAQDAGTAIHPSYVEGQMQGGAVQGIGWALSEGYVWQEDGAMSNASFLDYRIPTSLDLPMIDTQIIEVPNPGHPFGIRGVGEVPIVPPMAAIANAVHDATGVRMTHLPMSPGHVLEALGAIPREA